MPRGNLATLKHYKPKWKSGATQTIRVPIALTERLLDIARQLDGEDYIHLSQVNRVSSPEIDHLENQSLCLTKAELESLVEQVLADPQVTRKGKDRGSVKRALEALKSLVTSERN